MQILVEHNVLSAVYVVEIGLELAVRPDGVYVRKLGVIKEVWAEGDARTGEKRNLFSIPLLDCRIGVALWNRVFGLCRRASSTAWELGMRPAICKTLTRKRHFFDRS